MAKPVAPSGQARQKCLSCPVDTLRRISGAVTRALSALALAVALAGCQKCIHLQVHNHLKTPVEVVTATPKRSVVEGIVLPGGSVRFKCAFLGGPGPYHVVLRDPGGKKIREERRTPAELHDHLTRDNTWIIDLR